MLYLILSVVFSTGLNVLFKYFAQKEIDLFKVILINYFVCYTLGQVWNNSFISYQHIITTEWFGYAIILGLIFIVGFYLIALTVKYYGITIATVMQKMSLALTVIFALLFYSESFSFIKGLGLLLAIIAVVLTNIKKSEDLGISNISKNKVFIFIPIITFFLSGIIEILLLYVDREQIVNTHDHEFVTVLFGMAGIFALIYYVIGRFTRTMSPLTVKDLIAGLILGVINYFSIVFLLKLVQTGWEGSFIFPINNVAILILSVTFSILFFYERLSRLNYIGLALSIMAIMLIWSSSL